MLKIKDNVDLKELEKYGWTYYADKLSAYYGCCSKTDEKINWFINNAGIISMYIKNGLTARELDTLYDLIKDGLVEKVED